MWMILATLAYFFKKPRYQVDTILYIGIMTLAAFISLRANFLLLLLDNLTIIFLGSILIINKHNHFYVPQIITAPFRALIAIFTTKNKIDFDRRILEHPTRIAKGVNITKLLMSVAITAALLLVIVPLLATANPLFNQLVTSIIKDLSLTELFNKLFGDSFGIFLARLILTLVLFFFSLQIGSVAMTETEQKSTPLQHHISDILILPKMVVSFVILVFFVTQLQLYFATTATLDALSKTNSQVTREIFGQLSIVSLIILGLVFYDSGSKNLSKFSTYLLLIEGLFLSAIAFKSDFDYSARWGFTIARLYGFADVLWIVGTYAIYIHRYIKNLSNSEFLKRAIIWSLAVIVLINGLNFDYMIYHYRQPHTGEGTDHNYMERWLTSDASFLASELQYFYTLPMSFPDKNFYTFSVLIDRAERLQKKYKDIDLRSFNLSEYTEYLSIKDLKLDDFRRRLPTPPPQNSQTQSDQFTCTNYKSVQEVIANHDENTVCSLDLTNQNITEIPRAVLEFKHLHSLLVYENQITTIPADIDKLTELSQFDLRQNNISVLPPSIGNLKNLQELTLESNRISELPDEIGNLSQLQTLNVSRNDIRSLPSSISRLNNLSILSIYNNQLTELPESIGNMKTTTYIFASENRLTHLPQSIGNLQLKILAVNNNYLPPAEVKRLRSLFPNIKPTDLTLEPQN